MPQLEQVHVHRGAATCQRKVPRKASRDHPGLRCLEPQAGRRASEKQTAVRGGGGAARGLGEGCEAGSDESPQAASDPEQGLAEMIRIACCQDGPRSDLYEK